MREVVLIDTSVLCHLLNVPYMGDRHAEVQAEFRRLHEAGAMLTVPLTAVIEVGNHVAQNGDGDQRRKAADRFAKLIRKAVRRELPMQLIGITEARLDALLDSYPDYAMAQIGLGDQTIIDAFNSVCGDLPNHHVRIWSFDGDLAGYDRVP